MEEPATHAAQSNDHDTPGFLWGVATSAYQSEGGMNGDSPLRTNWAAAEESGQVEPVGRAADFWEKYREDFARCRTIGLNAFRLGLSWTRLQPDAPTASRGVDPDAADRYADILAECRASGLEPVVTLHHFTHPEWMGSDIWLDEDIPGRFAGFCETALREVGRRLADRHGQAPPRWLITINEPNMLVLNSYMASQFPVGRGRRGFRNAMRAVNGLLRAHVRAYGALHALYGAEGWPTPRVAFNNYCSDLYWSDKFLLDLVASKERGIPRSELHADICIRSEALAEAFRAAGLAMHRDLPYWFGRVFQSVSNWLGRHTFNPATFSPLLDEMEASPHTSFLDYIGLDYYDPFMAHLFRMPRFGDHVFHAPGLRDWMMNSVTSKWWDWRVLPRGLDVFCDYYSRDFGGRDILIAENGMALHRDRDNKPLPRADGMTRSRFLRLHVHEIQRILKKGVPVVGYLHWSLFDNYEWGSYTPRFGLYSLDYTRGTDRMDRDPSGDSPSETYARLIREFRREPAGTEHEKH